MNRYWDLTPKQRAALTREQVQACCTVELMEKGVLEIQPPVLQPEPVVLHKIAYFEILRKGEYSDEATGILFSDVETANAFLGMAPHFVDSRYQYGDENKFATAGSGLKIARVEYPSDTEVMAMAVTLKEVAAIRSANASAREKHRKDMRAVEDATKGVWEDWQEQVELKHTYAAIDATLEKYVGLCAGDELNARAYLSKCFDAETLKAWETWNATEN